MRELGGSTDRQTDSRAGQRKYSIAQTSRSLRRGVARGRNPLSSFSGSSNFSRSSFFPQSFIKSATSVSSAVAAGGLAVPLVAGRLPQKRARSPAVRCSDTRRAEGLSVLRIRADVGAG